MADKKTPPKKASPLWAVVVALAVMLGGCQSLPAAKAQTVALVVSEESQTLNPSGIAPLTAVLEMKTNVPVRPTVEVLAKDAAAGGKNLTYEFSRLTTEHRIPLLGLYAAHTNTVRVSFRTADNEVAGVREYTIATEPLAKFLPQVRIDFAAPEKMADGWTMLSFTTRAGGGSGQPFQPFMFDENGDIRWYFKFEGHPRFGNFIIENGPARLANGNLFFGESAGDAVYETDMLGNIINVWRLPGFGFHHQIVEKQNGNFLMTAEKSGAKTTQDYVVELDRQSGAVVNAWDMKESLQYSRRVLIDSSVVRISPDVDWFHGNDVIHSPADDTVIVSGRTQGVVKLNADNEVVWILGAHRGWGVAGNGADLNRFLLQPLDAAGNPITDAAVLDGGKNHPDFEWPWYQHSPLIMPNGNILVFDNGETRNFKLLENGYSRTVEYDIDEDAMTVRQVWQYGKERGEELFSRYVSGPEYIADKHHIIVSSGGVRHNGVKHGKVVELNYDTREVVFEASIIAPGSAGHSVFHRSERMPIVPPNFQRQ